MLLFTNVAYGYDVVTTLYYDLIKFTVEAILFRVIQCKKMDTLMFLAFLVRIGLE